MCKSDLIKRVAALNPTLSEKACRALVEAFFRAITVRLENGGDVELRGFGRFFLTQYGERTVRNPRTGEILGNEPFTAVRFRAGKAMDARLNN